MVKRWLQMFMMVVGCAVLAACSGSSGPSETAVEETVPEETATDVPATAAPTSIPAPTATAIPTPPPPTATAVPSPTPTPIPSRVAITFTEDSLSEIGGGRPVVMARANWASGYVQAEIYKQILEQLGYDVSSPSAIELAPDLVYSGMAEGTIDLWTNSWYPGHFTWWETPTSDGRQAGDNLVRLPGLLEGGALQGFLITKSVADEYGITSLDQINGDPVLVDLFDIDGNGKAELFGCPVAWTCDDIINNQIAFYGWDNIEQVTKGYDSMFLDAQRLVTRGEPTLIYTWTPSPYITDLRPGENVYWLSAHPTDVLDDSNPAGTTDGEYHDQAGGSTNVAFDQCTQPCQLGWEAADIQVTTNADWADANPEAIAVMSQIRPAVIDISEAQVEQANGDGTQQHVEEIAARWIADNQNQINQWIEIGLAESGWVAAEPAPSLLGEWPTSPADAGEWLRNVTCAETNQLSGGGTVALVPSRTEGDVRLLSVARLDQNGSIAVAPATVTVVSAGADGWTMDWKIQSAEVDFETALELSGADEELVQELADRMSELSELTVRYGVTPEGAISAADPEALVREAREITAATMDIFAESGIPEEMVAIMQGAADSIGDQRVLDDALAYPYEYHAGDGWTLVPGEPLHQPVQVPNVLSGELYESTVRTVLEPELSPGGCAILTLTSTVPPDVMTEQIMTTIELLAPAGYEPTAEELAEIENALLVSVESQSSIAWDLAEGRTAAVLSGRTIASSVEGDTQSRNDMSLMVDVTNG